MKLLKNNFYIIVYSLFLIIYNFILWIFASSFSVLLSDIIGFIFFFSLVPSYFFMIYSTKKKGGTIKFYMIFLMLTILFYYGQHILVIINKDYLLNQDYTILDGRISSKSIINATFLIIQSLLLIHIGYFSAIKNENILRKEIMNKAKINNRISKEFKITALIFFFLSSVAMLNKLIYLIKLNKSYGYLERRALESSKEFIEGMGSYTLYFSEWFIPSLYMLFLFNIGRIKGKIIYIIILIFSGLYLMAGSRFLLLKLGMGIFLIQCIWIKQPNKKTIKKFFFGGIIGVFILKFISVSRGNMGFNYEKIYFNIIKLWKTGIFSEILWETGITFTSISNVIDKVPFFIPYFGGKSYLGSILIFLPSFFRFDFFENYKLSVSSILSPLYYNTNLIGYGSSFIAEAYYNFGYLMLFFMIGIGSFFGKLENILIGSKISRNAPLFFFITYIFSELIYIVRNDVYAIPRSILFYALVPLVVYRGLKILNIKY